jgi:hypothetical protein
VKTLAENTVSRLVATFPDFDTQNDRITAANPPANRPLPPKKATDQPGGLKKAVPFLRYHFRNKAFPFSLLNQL